MISYIKLLISNYRFWRKIKKNKIILWQGKFPSQIYYKYHPTEEFKGKKVLIVGSGSLTYKAPNVTNTDICNSYGVNMILDLSKPPFPFESNSYDLIIANHVLEHVPNWFEAMKELARIVKVGGMIEVWVPPISSDTAFSYRDHINRIGWESFAGCASISRPGSNLQAAEQHATDLGEFRKLTIAAVEGKPIITWWTMILPIWALNWVMYHLRNTVSEIGFKFIKKDIP